MQFKFLIVAVLCLMLIFPALTFANGLHDGHNADTAVGELYTVEGKLDTNEQGPFNVRFQAVRLEDGANILSMNNRSIDGSYRFSAQFFDGAEHEVTVSLIQSETNAILSEKKMNVVVQAFHPPMPVKIKSLAFMLLVIAAGMTLGVGAAQLGKRTQIV